MDKFLIICVNERHSATQPSCARRGSKELAERLERLIAREQLAIVVLRFKCLGHCSEGPTLKLMPGGELLLGMSEEQVVERVRAFAAQPARQTVDN